MMTFVCLLFIPSHWALHLSCQLIAAQKKKGKICFSVRLDSGSGMRIRGQKAIQYLWHTIYM